MRNRKHRWMWTTAAVTASVCGAAIAQETPGAIPAVPRLETTPAVAASAPASGDAQGGAGLLDEAAAAEQAAERALNARVGAIRFDAAPATDALQFIAEQAGVDLVVDPRIEADQELGQHTVTLEVARGKISVRTALEIVLEQIGPDVTYTIRDGLVYITNAADAATVVVYDCRDLLERSPRPSSAGSAMEALVPGSAPARPAELFSGNADDLVQVLVTTVAPDSWSEAGGFGTVTNYRGLIVVKHSAAVHRQLRELLSSLRSAMHPPAPVAAPESPREDRPRRDRRDSANPSEQ